MSIVTGGWGTALIITQGYGGALEPSIVDSFIRVRGKFLYRIVVPEDRTYDLSPIEDFLDTQNLPILVLEGDESNIDVLGADLVATIRDGKIKRHKKNGPTVIEGMRGVLVDLEPYTDDEMARFIMNSKSSYGMEHILDLTYASYFA
jgi:hypothetical protein